MAKAVKEKDKRKSYLNKIAGRASAQYLKYKDFEKKDVHEGTATLGAYDFTDDPGTSIGHYGRAVKTGHGKSYFRFQGKLYKTTNSSGTTSEEVKV